MKNAVFVRVLDRQRDIADRADLLPERDAALLPPFGERRTLDEFHRDEMTAVLFAGLVDRDDVRMLGEVGGELRLADEALDLAVTGARDGFEIAAEHLERDLPVELRIERLIDRSDRALSDPPQIPVASERLKVVRRFGFRFGGQ